MIGQMKKVIRHHRITVTMRAWQREREWRRAWRMDEDPRQETQR
jgi:hypothetical protein